MDKEEINEEENKPKSKPIIIKSTTDLQRLKLEKLMKHPQKPIIIPEKPKERGVPTVPDFVRNVMGSSAGAGSGEFHVYRHLRRKEYARQKYMKEKGERERLDDEYHRKLDEYKQKSEERTLKKRKKRLKKKQKQKSSEKKQKLSQKSSSSSSEDSGSDSENAENISNQDAQSINEAHKVEDNTNTVNTNEKCQENKEICYKIDEINKNS